MNKPAPPVELSPAWVVGDYDFTDLSCEFHAVEYADERGLEWEYPGSTSESANGYAYAVVFGDLESDAPGVCGVCGLHLDTRLTPDGVEYVRDTYPPEWWHLWGIDE